MPKGEAIVSTIKGTAHIISSEKNSEQRMIRVDHSEMISDTYEVPEGWKIQVDEEAEVSMGDPIASQEGAVITAAHAGRVRIENGNVIVSYENRESEDYEIPSTSRIIISDGAKVEAGQPLTEGSINPHTILKIKGRDATELYLLKEIQQVYRTQGQNINDKHFEVVIRKMLNKVQITRPGDTPYLPQDLVDRLELRKMNEQACLLKARNQPIC